MLKFNNLRLSKLGMIILSSLLLSGCGNQKNEDNKAIDYDDNGVKAYAFENGSSSFLTIQELDGINRKTYRDLVELVAGDVDVLKLISPDEFDLYFLSDLDIDNLELITPKKDFDFSGISTLNNLDSISVTIGSDTDLKGFINYIKRLDLSETDLTIKIIDSTISEKFSNILKNNSFKAKSITLEVNSLSCLNYLNHLNADSVKVSLLINEDIDPTINIKLNKAINKFVLEFVSDNKVTINLNKLVIESNNSNVNVSIEKTSRVKLIIPKEAILKLPEGTTIDIERENILELKQDN